MWSGASWEAGVEGLSKLRTMVRWLVSAAVTLAATVLPGAAVAARWTDRKSTRLNSSHTVISYAVFCLNDPATTERATLSLHDALPISASPLQSVRFGEVAALNVERRELGGGRGRAVKTPDDGSLAGERSGDAGGDGSARRCRGGKVDRSEEHTSELQSHSDLVCRLLLE